MNANKKLKKKKNQKIELDTLHGWIICYVNYVSIKQEEKNLKNWKRNQESSILDMVNLGSLLDIQMKMLNR